MTPLWTAAEAAAATGGIARGAWEAADVAIDTRGLAPGTLFVALRGDHRDGHAFVGEALGHDAAAMVARLEPGWPEPAPLLVVGDTLSGLQALGRAARARSSARVAAVTGSVGKTGTKEALRHVLARQGFTHASAASHNNHWGVPLTLARLPRDARFAVLELGMNHPGEIAALTRQARPHVAMVTRIAAAHLGPMGSLDAIAAAKAEIFEGLEPGGVAVLPADDPMLPLLRRAAESAGAGCVTFGRAEGADWRLVDVALSAERSLLAVAGPNGAVARFTLGAPGAHWAGNAVGVLAVAAALGADPEAAGLALADLAPPAGRGLARRIALPGGGEALLLDESYNANPASMRAALELLGLQPRPRIAVLGDMLELGAEAPRLHAELADACIAAGIDRLDSCGPLTERLRAALPAGLRGHHAETAALLAPRVRATLEPGQTVLVKGSLGSRMRDVVQALVATDPSPRHGAA